MHLLPILNLVVPLDSIVISGWRHIRMTRASLTSIGRGCSWWGWRRRARLIYVCRRLSSLGLRVLVESVLCSSLLTVELRVWRRANGAVIVYCVAASLAVWNGFVARIWVGRHNVLFFPLVLSFEEWNSNQRKRMEGGWKMWR
jgi:hypothetical protein